MALLLNRPYKHESNSNSSCRHSASCFQTPLGLMRTSFIAGVFALLSGDEELIVGRDSVFVYCWSFPQVGIPM